MSRNLFIDYLKGVAIFLVVWGHGIQFLDDEYNCFGNSLFLFIYSFHMPLFMCISGYLFAFSSKKTFVDVVKLKSTQLLVPVLCWGVLLTWLSYHKEIESLGFREMGTRYIRLYVERLPYHLWFLWSLFLISLLVSFFARWKYNRVVIYSILFLFLLCLPDFRGLSYLKFMYPFFMIGYFYNVFSSSLQKYKRSIIIACYIIFPLCLLFWSKIDLFYKNDILSYSISGALIYSLSEVFNWIYRDCSHLYIHKKIFVFP